MTEQEKREWFFAKTKLVATSATVEYQAFLCGMEFAEDAVRKMCADICRAEGKYWSAKGVADTRDFELCALRIERSNARSEAQP